MERLLSVLCLSNWYSCLSPPPAFPQMRVHYNRKKGESIGRWYQSILWYGSSQQISDEMSKKMKGSGESGSGGLQLSRVRPRSRTQALAQSKLVLPARRPILKYYRHLRVEWGILVSWRNAKNGPEYTATSEPSLTRLAQWYGLHALMGTSTTTTSGGSNTPVSVWMKPLVGDGRRFCHLKTSRGCWNSGRQSGPRVSRAKTKVA